jgi:hypothetical protein
VIAAVQALRLLAMVKGSHSPTSEEELGQIIKGVWVAIVSAKEIILRRATVIAPGSEDSDVREERVCRNTSDAITYIFYTLYCDGQVHSLTDTYLATCSSKRRMELKLAMMLLDEM